MAADEVVAVSKDTITLCESSRTTGIINSHIIPTADFILNRDFNFQSRKVNERPGDLAAQGLLLLRLHQAGRSRCSATPSPPTS